MDQAAVDEYAVGRPVLGQRERLVAVRRLPLHPLEDGLRLGAGADAQHVGAGDVQERLEVVTPVNLCGGDRDVGENPYVPTVNDFEAWHPSLLTERRRVA